MVNNRRHLARPTQHEHDTTNGLCARAVLALRAELAAQHEHEAIFYVVPRRWHGYGTLGHMYRASPRPNANVTTHSKAIGPTPMLQLIQKQSSQVL
jgi:hypothetical protein